MKSPLTPSEGEIGRGLIYMVSFVVLSLAFVGFLFRGHAPLVRIRPYVAAVAIGLAAEAMYGVSPARST